MEKEPVPLDDTTGPLFDAYDSFVGLLNDADQRGLAAVLTILNLRLHAVLTGGAQ